MIMAQRTFEVEHPGTHYPTDAQSRAALRELLKADGIKLSGDVEFLLVENVSGGPSKVRATYQAADEPASDTRGVKVEPKTKTIGG